MPKLIDLTNRTFGRWRVIERDNMNGNHGQVQWICQCMCGEIRSVIGGTLLNGKSQSCGCLNKESHIRHGMSRTPEYQTWLSLKNRCLNSDSAGYENYGARGIGVHPNWINSFDNFYQDMGPRPSENHSIERIDNNGDYGPENCKWALIIEQANNRRNNILVSHNGVEKTKAEIAREHGISRNLLRERMAQGQTLEEAIQKPPNSYKHATFFYEGKERNISELSLLTGIKQDTLYYRLIKANWPLEKALKN